MLRFTHRVIEIGIYKPKFYPFVYPYQSCWIVGARIETPSSGSSVVKIETLEQLEQLERNISEARASGSSLVSYEETEIDIEDAEYLASSARKQLSQPHKLVAENDEIDGRKVLIIEENAEDLGYSTAESEIRVEGHYTLYPNHFLKQPFELKSHQREGVAWLQYLFKNKVCGCLMADDMGLGKTLQILYFIDWHSRNFPNHKPYLIVAPVSLLENWENEYKRFFAEPRLEVSRVTSKEVPRTFHRDVIHTLQSSDIILTNYESLRISQMNFCAVEYDIVVLDEAQKIKSPGTLVSNAAKALQGGFKIAVIGTPVENSLLDLWCIMDFCVPGLLGNAKTFSAKYQNPLKNEDVDIVALGKELHDKLGIYFMRRLKKDVAGDLPQKHEVKEEKEMPKIQEEMYTNVVQNYLNGSRQNILTTIMQIREISEHPYLHDSSMDREDNREIIEASARLQISIGFIDRIKERNEKVIVFVERKEMQQMLQRVFYNRYGIIAKIINGDTPSLVSTRGSKQSRQSSIDEFQSRNGFNIIIMSPIAAGMGLNVTAANNVIHYSRHWNPAKENQATDRAYRIGQTKDVFVYYPMAVSPNFTSFDKTLDGLLGRKTALATSTIFPTERIEVRQDELGQLLFGDNS
jgi:SNF2 family DNA or RNA helicase